MRAVSKIQWLCNDSSIYIFFSFFKRDNNIKMPVLHHHKKLSNSNHRTSGYSVLFKFCSTHCVHDVQFHLSQNQFYILCWYVCLVLIDEQEQSQLQCHPQGDQLPARVLQAHLLFKLSALLDDLFLEHDWPPLQKLAWDILSKRQDEILFSLGWGDDGQQFKSSDRQPKLMGDN